MLAHFIVGKKSFEILSTTMRDISMRIQEIVNKNIGKSVLRSKIWYELRDQESKVLASSEDEVLE